MAVGSSAEKGKLRQVLNLESEAVEKVRPGHGANSKKWCPKRHGPTAQFDRTKQRAASLRPAKLVELSAGAER